MPRFTTHLPSIANEDPRVPLRPYPCGMNENAYEFARAWLALHGDRAKRMVCDARLVKAAQDHANYLNSRTGDQLNESMHRGRGGSYSNQRVLAAGYRLPSNWKAQANFVESCKRTWRTPADACITLSQHSTHTPHMLGRDFFADSMVYGVGAAGSDYVAVRCPKEK